MFRAKHSAVLLASFLFLACGGSSKPPVQPDTDTSANADGGSDMPAPSATTADTAAPAGGDAKPATDTAPPKSSITVAAMKFTPAKGKKAKAIAIAADGAVTADGKPAGKIAGDHVEDASGKTIVSVGADGALSGDGVKSGLKFSGDDVVGDDGNKVVTVGDDGTVQVSNGKKMDTFGKFDNGSSAKKAAALAAVAWFMAAPAPAAPAGKPAGKPAGGKKK